MARPRALDLFCCGGGVSEGLRRAGFEVVGVDIVDHSRVYNREPDEKLGAGPGAKTHECPARFVQADALEVLEAICSPKSRRWPASWFHVLGPFHLICASPPCQAHSSLRHLQAGKVYPDLIEPVREFLKRWGGLWCIENVPGAPLGGANLTMLCGTMFGLQTPDGRAELRRHRLFETSFSIPLRPACQHGASRSLSVSGHVAEISKGWERCPPKSCITVTGDRPNSSNTPRKVVCVGDKAMSGGMSKPKGMLAGRPAQERETFSTDDARHAMGIDWMPMKQLSQAIPPAYAEWIGRQAIQVLAS